MRFHIDYYEGKGDKPNPDESIAQQAVVQAILEKHDAATNLRRFNATLATASINNAIEYYRLFKEIQNKKKAENAEYVPLHIACVFSPPAQLIAKEGDQQSQKNAADVKQMQEDLKQEQIDNKTNPEEKKKALIEIIADYNLQFGCNHSINEFDLYYQDIQSRIKDQKYSNQDYPHKNKIDITIVVDMLLTGFNRLPYYVDVFIDKKREFLIPENVNDLSELEQEQCYLKWQAVEAYVKVRQNKKSNLCGICKFYEGIVHEFIICTYKQESKLDKIFNENDLDKI